MKQQTIAGVRVARRPVSDPLEKQIPYPVAEALAAFLKPGYQPVIGAGYIVTGSRAVAK